jgi:hypothetical protein
LRRLAIAWIGLFGLSVAFPIVASLMPETARPSWLGPLDLTVAGLVIALALYLLTTVTGAIDLRAQALAYRVLRAISATFLVLVAIVLLAPRALDWTVLGVGLAWRAWLLVIVLPGIIVHVGLDTRIGR